MGETDYWRGAWWKGTFPMWLVVALLAIIGWFLKRYVDEVDGAVKASNARIETILQVQNQHNSRIGVLEIQTQGFNAIVGDIKSTQVDIKNDIRDLRHDLKK